MSKHKYLLKITNGANLKKGLKIAHIYEAFLGFFLRLYAGEKDKTMKRKVKIIGWIRGCPGELVNLWRGQFKHRTSLVRVVIKNP
jgi:hypothetical protein